ncbi:MAG: cold shock and DUF1294 domain-containing protein [Candidatus Competibacter sp.]
MRYQGTITHWNDGKGFGFITPEHGGEKIFIHANALNRCQARPQISDVVTYEIEINGKQKSTAVKIEYQESPIKYSTFNMGINGTITDWNDKKGFGFITPDDSSEKIFLHINALAAGQCRPQLSDSVSYEVGSDDQRRPCAINVRYRNYRFRSSFFNLSFLGPITFFAILFWMAIKDIIPLWILIVYVSASFLTLLEYAFDKHKARQRKWRTSEAMLHALELLGGWPGALIAQRIFRHKNRKIAFQISFWMIVLIHLSFWVWFLVQRPDWLLKLSSWSWISGLFMHSTRIYP